VHRGEVADVAVDHAKQRDDGRLVGRNRIEIAHVRNPKTRHAFQLEMPQVQFDESAD
jgi:hypothetical protein